MRGHVTEEQVVPNPSITTREQDEPQYEINSDKTAHIALYEGSALRYL